jgi:hypothetical protein
MIVGDFIEMEGVKGIAGRGIVDYGLPWLLFSSKSSIIVPPKENYRDDYVWSRRLENL